MHRTLAAGCCVTLQQPAPTSGALGEDGQVDEMSEDMRPSGVLRRGGRSDVALHCGAPARSGVLRQSPFLAVVPSREPPRWGWVS